MEQQKTNHSKKYTNKAVLARTIGTGAFMGIVFYLLWLLITTFNFTPYPVHYYIQRGISLLLDAPKWFESILVIVIISLLSIVVALLYYIVAKKWVSIWVGILYGILIGAIHMFVIHPPLVGESLFFLSYASTISILSMHILYGVSIGFSISFDYTESLAHRKLLQTDEKHM